MRAMRSAGWLVAAGVLAAGVAFAQPGGKPEPAKPEPVRSEPLKPGPESGVPGVLPPGYAGEHRLLAELTGSFNATVRLYAGAGKEPVEVKGVAVRKMGLNSRFLQESLEVLSAPTPFTDETAIGFNPDGKDGERFELCRLSSGSFAMIVERGGFDSPSKTFTFRGEHRVEGKVVKTRTVLRLDAHHIQTVEIYETHEDASGKVVTPEFNAVTVEYVRAS